MSKGPPLLKEGADPTGLVELYKGLEAQRYIGVLAPSLGLLINKKLYDPSTPISPEFSDVDAFLGVTHPHTPMLMAVGTVNDALQSSSGALTLPLTMEMGFGKTHFLTLLWHLYTEAPLRWSELNKSIELEDRIQKIAETRYRIESAKKTLVFAVDLKTLPEGTKPYNALFKTASRVIEKYDKSQSLGLDSKRFAKSIEALSDKRPFDAASELANILRKTALSIPVLIMIDELYASIFEVVEGGSEESIEGLKDLFSFLVTFVERTRETNPVVLVYASARQDVERWYGLTRHKEYLEKRHSAYSLVSMVEHFMDRASRIQYPVEEISPDEAIEIAIRRLLKFKAPRDELKMYAIEGLIPIIQGLLGDKFAFKFREGLLKTYPFAPSYMLLINKLLAPTATGDFPKTQHIRDLLKITSSLIARLHDGEWDVLSLISPAYLVHGDVNHLMSEKYAAEWKQLFDSCVGFIAEEKDETVKFLAEKMFSTVYLKSITTNISKLISMMRNVEAVPRTEAFGRGTTYEDLIFSMVGAVPQDYLEKLEAAKDSLDRAPHVMGLEREGLKLYIMSFMGNPIELIDSFKREEMSTYLTPDGSPDFLGMIGYFRMHMEKEYEGTTLFQNFQKFSEAHDNPRISLIEHGAFVKVDDTGKPNFINYLDRDFFTILVITPWSIGMDAAQKKEPVDYTEKVRGLLDGAKETITYPNMFTAVIPETLKDSLKAICDEIAQVRAAKRVVEHYKIKEFEEARRKKLELAKKMKGYKTLQELLEEEEKTWEEIMVEVMDTLQKRMEEYAQKATNTAVQDYAALLVEMFKHVIYFGSEKRAFLKDDLLTKHEAKDEFGKVHSELPVWLSNAVMSKCNVDRELSIRSKLIAYLLGEAIRREVELLSGKLVRIESDTILTLSKKGWEKLPIRPLSDADFKGAVNKLPGVYQTSSKDLPFIAIYLEVEADKQKIVLKKHEELVPPPKPPTPPKTVSKVIITGVSEGIAGISLLRRDDFCKNLKDVSLLVELWSGAKVAIENSPKSDMEKMFGKEFAETFMNRLSPMASDIKTVNLTFTLSNPVNQEDMASTLRSVGVRKSVKMV